MAQDNLWANGQQLVDFNDPTAQAAVCAFPSDPGLNRYHEQVPQYSQNAQYDENGKLLFFVVDGNIYDHAGYLMADNDMDPNCFNCMVKGLQEMLITRMPGTCDKYYVIGGNKIGESTAFGYSILDLSKPNPFFPLQGRYGALWRMEDVGSYPLLFQQMNYSIEGIKEPQGPGTPQRSVCALGTSKVLTGDANIHLCILDGPAGAEPPTLFVQLGPSLKYANITAQGINNQGANDELVLRPLTPFLGLPYSGGIAVSKTTSDGIVRLARTYNRGSVPETNSNFSIEISSVTFSGNIVSDAVLFQVNTDLSGTHVGYGTVHGLAFSPNGRYLYFAQATTPYIGYIDMLDPTYTYEVVDLAAQLGLAPAAMSAYGYGQIACNKGPLPNTWSMYFPKAAGFGRLDNIDDAPNVTAAMWTADAAPDAGSFSAPPNSVLPSWNHYLMDRQNYRDQQIPNLQQGECCQDNERIPEWSHPYTFSGTTTAANPWTTTQNGLIGPMLCTWPLDANNQPIGHAYFEHDFVIQAGAKLYVQGMEWRFAPTASLIIEPGAFVKFDNCLLRGGACEPERWPGVDLRGTPYMAQGASPAFPPNHGRLVFNNSTLQDADVGVTLGKKSGWFGKVAKAGGIIQSNGSTFKNCHVGVNFYPYKNMTSSGYEINNNSYFYNTTFTTDAYYIDHDVNGYDFAVQAQMWRVKGIRYMGCTFQNLRTTENQSSKRGQGIRSLDADYAVTSRCADPGPVPAGFCQNLIPSRFIDLDHGIHAYKAGNIFSFRVDESEFNDNVCGVYVRGVPGFQVQRSTFNVGGSQATILDNSEELNWYANRGTYSYGSQGFLLEHNTAQRSSNVTSNVNREGFVTGWSGASDDLVRWNKTKNLEIGFVGEGICSDLSQVHGLAYRCNRTEGDNVGIYSRVVPTGIQSIDQQQIIRYSQGSSDGSAGNEFIGNAVDLRNDNPSRSFEYWWWYDQPIPYYPSTIVGNISRIPTAKPNDCDDPRPVRPPDHDDPFPLPEPTAYRTYLMDVAQVRKLEYGNTRYLYDQLIDGGNTDETVQEIQSSWPNEAWELRSMLLEKSPYLSSEVLMEVVKKNVMPVAMVAEIYIANPEATQKGGLVKWLEFEAPITMPQYLLDNIQASWDQKTYRSTLEKNMSFSRGELSQAIYHVVASYNADTTGIPVDSIRSALQVLRTPDARYMEILTYLQQDNFDSANAVMDRLPVEFKLKEQEISEKDRTKQYISMVQGWHNAGRTDAELNEGEVTALQSLVEDYHDRPAEWAQNLLCFGYGICNAPLSGGGSEPQAMLRPVSRPEVPLPALKLSPNPANAWVAMNYRLDNAADKACLIVRDAIGREVDLIHLAETEGQAVYDTRRLSQGTYTVELMNSGRHIEAQKLVVQP